MGTDVVVGTGEGDGDGESDGTIIFSEGVMDTGISEGTAEVAVCLRGAAEVAGADSSGSGEGTSVEASGVGDGEGLGEAGSSATSSTPEPFNASRTSCRTILFKMIC